MADEENAEAVAENSETVTTTQEKPAAPGEQQVTMTQNELDALIKREKGRAMRSASKKASATVAAPPEQQQSETNPEINAAIAALTEQVTVIAQTVQSQQAKVTEAEFDAAISGYNVSDEQKANYKTLWDNKSPETDFAKVLESMGATKGEDLSQQGPGFKSPGGPSPKPLADRTNPLQWSKDDIDRMRAEGTFLGRLKEHSAKGRSQGLFRPKTRK